MFEDTIAQYGTKFVVAALAVLLGLACLALVLWIVRRRPSSPFIRGGRNRQPRLSVLDAAAVDTRRRLVLIRRDDVEHLLMIGGPTDIVIESRILSAPSGELTEYPRPAAIPVEPVAAAAPSAPVPINPVPAAVRPSATLPTVPAAPPQSSVQEKRPEPVIRSMPPSGVSAMGQVLYGGEAEASVPPRFAPPSRDALPAALNATAGMPDSTPAVPRPSISERSAIDALDRARDRVLTNPIGTGSERIGGQHELPGPRDLPPVPAQAVADNAALVSEFEKILEAEIAMPAARAPNGSSPGSRTEPATIVSGKELPVSREETEAEMVRLLGELSATRKS